MKRKRRSVFLAALALCIFILTGTAFAAFPDVAAESPCASAVAEMESQGLLSGYLDGRFYPARTISAAQFVTIAARCAGLEPVPAQTNHWAAGSLQAALQAGRYDWDELPPTGERFDLPVSRQLAVKILMRAFLPEVRGDYPTESRKINDFARLDGRYYEPVPIPAPVVGTAQGGVSENGWLQVIGTQLCNEAGEPVVLRGMSSHGIQWYGQFTSVQAIANTARQGANLFRVAVYTEEGGYLSNPDAIFQKAAAAVCF